MRHSWPNSAGVTPEILTEGSFFARECPDFGQHLRAPASCPARAVFAAGLDSAPPSSGLRPHGRAAPSSRRPGPQYSPRPRGARCAPSARDTDGDRRPTRAPGARRTPLPRRKRRHRIRTPSQGWCQTLDQGGD